MLTTENGIPTYQTDTFKIKMLRYSDPQRLSLAENCAIYLGKSDLNNTRRPLTLLKKKHKSVFRGEHVKFEFWTSKPVYDHLITYTTAQLRACGGLRANEAQKFIPPAEDNDPLYEELGNLHLSNYQKLVHGISPETEDPMQKKKLQAARSIAPMSVELHYVFQYNFLTLMESIFPQRIWEPGAQLDTQQVVHGMWELVKSQDEELWILAEDIYGTESIAWEKIRTKLKKDNPKLFDILMDKYGQLKTMW